MIQLINETRTRERKSIPVNITNVKRVRSRSDIISWLLTERKQLKEDAKDRK